MGRYRDHRQPRSEGFQSDNDAQGSEPTYFDRRPLRRASSPAETSPAHDAEVVWFNVEKGFGFLKLSDGSDAFMHLSKLQAAGYDSLPEGALLKVRTEPGQRGPQVVEVISVEVGDRTAKPRAATRPAPVSEASPDTREHEGTGVVKRYDQNKGFGFIALEGGGKDVFVHATALARNGLAALDAGQNVAVTYAQGHKGLEVRTIRLR
jgi:cold shock protein